MKFFFGQIVYRVRITGALSHFVFVTLPLPVYTNLLHIPIYTYSQSQNIQEYGLSQSQRALLTCIEEGITSIRQAESQMDKGAALPNLGNDAVSHRCEFIVC